MVSAKEVLEGKKETQTPDRVYTPKEPMTSDKVFRLLIKDLDPFEILIGGNLYLRDVLTAKPGAKNRNATYQRSIMRRVIDKLIAMGLIK